MPQSPGVLAWLGLSEQGWEGSSGPAPCTAVENSVQLRGGPGLQMRLSVAGADQQGRLA